MAKKPSYMVVIEIPEPFWFHFTIHIKGESISIFLPKM
jgi:hypothetical protein